MLTVDSFRALKVFIDGEYEAVLGTLRPSEDSDRLTRNKILGFVIALQDRLAQLKPVRCGRCDKDQMSQSGASKEGHYGAQLSRSRLILPSNTDRFNINIASSSR